MSREVWRRCGKARHRRRRTVCSTAVEFARELADAVESQAIEEFRTKYRGAELLVLEDLHQLISEKSGKLNAQEELVQTLDAHTAEGHWVIVTALISPAELPGLTSALRSRLTAGLSFALAPPGPEARLAVLHQLASIRDVQLPASVAEVLAERLSGTVPELAGALMQLAAPTLFDDKPLDSHTARQFLADRTNEHPAMHDIALATARHFRLRLSELRSSVRRRSLVTARGVAIYLARNLAGMSLQEIGEYFGGRDHSTVMHSCRKTEEMFQRDPAIHEAVEKLRQKLWKT